MREARTPSFRGTLAVTSLQHCNESAFRGFGLYDLTDPRNPKRLSRRPHRGRPRLARDLARERARPGVGVHGDRALRAAVLARLRPQAADGDEAGPRGLPHLRRHRPAQPGPGRRVGLLEGARHPPERGPGRLSGQPRPLGDHRRRGASGRTCPTGISARSSSTSRSPPGRATSGGHGCRRGSRRATPTPPRSPRAGASWSRPTRPSWAGPALFDISNPRRPKLLGTLRLPAADSAPKPLRSLLRPQRPRPEGASATSRTSRGTATGIVVADISRPARPKVVARFVPPGARIRATRAATARACAFVWGVFATKDYVLASDMNSGLWVLRLTRGASGASGSSRRAPARRPRRCRPGRRARTRRPRAT